MNLILHPRPLSGRIAAIPSKSWAHRLLLGAALSGSPLSCPAISFREMWRQPSPACQPWAFL